MSAIAVLLLTGHVQDAPAQEPKADVCALAAADAEATGYELGWPPLPDGFDPRELAGTYELTVVAVPGWGGPGEGSGTLVLEAVPDSLYPWPFCFGGNGWDRDGCRVFAPLRGHVNEEFPFPVSFVECVSPASRDAFEPGVQGRRKPLGRSLDFHFGNPVSMDGALRLHGGAIFIVSRVSDSGFGGTWLADDYLIPTDGAGRPSGREEAISARCACRSRTRGRAAPLMRSARGRCRRISPLV